MALINHLQRKIIKILNISLPTRGDTKTLSNCHNKSNIINLQSNMFFELLDKLTQNSLSPLLLICCFPVINFILYISCSVYDGSVSLLFTDFMDDPYFVLNLLPIPSREFYVVIISFFVFEFLIMKYVAGKVEPGPWTPNGLVLFVGGFYV